MKSFIVSASAGDLIDTFSQMIEETSFNPYNISTDIELNQGLLFGDFTDNITKEMNDYINIFGSSITLEIFNDILKAQAFKLVESYYKNAGFVPKKIVDIIIEQVFNAASMSDCLKYRDANSLEIFKYRVYYALTNR